MRPDPQRVLDYREFPILCVDDEPENLRIFELGLRREFSIYTAGTGEDALRIFNERPIAVVLSDQRMPGMSGVELLARVRELDPKAIRVLVTAYGDAETLSRAVNDSSIYRYVPKPWDLDEMRITLRRAIEVYALEGEREALLQELTILSRVSHSINQQPELEPLLDLVLAMLTGEFGYDGATLFFFEDGGTSLLPRRASPGEGEVAEWLRGFALSEDDAPKCLSRLRDGEVQILSLDTELELEGAVRRWVMEVSADEILVVPLIGRQDVIGALAIDNRRGGRSFRVQDRTLLEGLATQVVTAIENARLVEDLRHARAEAERADQAGAFGTLASSLAQEMRAPLAAVQSFLAQAPAQRAGGDAAFWQDLHGRAVDEADRLHGIASAIERLPRGWRGAAEMCDLAAVIEEVVRARRELARTAGVDVSVVCDPAAPKIVAVREQLRQVVDQLLRNAIQATASGGHVTIRLDPRDGGVGLEVGDDGCGIAPEHLERIFDPFFTTRESEPEPCEAGRGRGLGLAICQHFVARHGGTIEVRSQLGEGTTLCIQLPPGDEGSERSL